MRSDAARAQPASAISACARAPCGFDGRERRPAPRARTSCRRSSAATARGTRCGCSAGMRTAGSGGRPPRPPGRSSRCGPRRRHPVGARDGGPRVGRGAGSRKADVALRARSRARASVRTPCRQPLDIPEGVRAAAGRLPVQPARASPVGIRAAPRPRHTCGARCCMERIVPGPAAALPERPAARSVAFSPSFQRVYGRRRGRAPPPWSEPAAVSAGPGVKRAGRRLQ